MSMAGTPAEYERMALKSIEKAAEDVSDTTYHLYRAQIFAALASAAATEGVGSPRSRRSSPRPEPAERAPAEPTGPVVDAEDDGRHLPAVRAS